MRIFRTEMRIFITEMRIFRTEMRLFRTDIFVKENISIKLSFIFKWYENIYLILSIFWKISILFADHEFWYHYLLSLYNFVKDMEGPLFQHFNKSIAYKFMLIKLPSSGNNLYLFRIRNYSLGIIKFVMNSI